MVQIQEPRLFAKDAPIPHGGLAAKLQTLRCGFRFGDRTPLQLDFGAATEFWLWYKQKPMHLLEIEFPTFLTLLKILYGLVYGCAKWLEIRASFIGIGLREA
jgi:hypothetical protein